MNPFDLPGPPFLVFYVALGLAVLMWMYTGRAREENGAIPQVDLSDPYVIAYLRGGAQEAALVACVCLVDRGLLEVRADGTLRAPHPEQALPIPLEQELVHAFKSAQPSYQMFQDHGVELACARYETTLTRLGLLPDAEAEVSRRSRLALALLILIAVAAVKAYIGLRREAPIGLLLLFTIVLGAVAVIIHDPWLTARGVALLADLRRLFARLRERAGTLRPGRSSDELALLLAVFGLAALPRDRFAWAHRFLPRAGRRARDRSSCGSGCGTGCGGGGCGGGCGGCGGGGD